MGTSLLLKLFKLLKLNVQKDKTYKQFNEMFFFSFAFHRIMEFHPC